MKKLFITIIFLLLVGIISFGYKFLIITTKDTIVNQKEYLGDHKNSAEIYSFTSSGNVYSPFNGSIISMDKLMLIDISDDPKYLTIELQTFNDIRGRGARVLLYPHKGPAESYYTNKIFVIKESGNDRFYIDPGIKYYLKITKSGLDAYLQMQDHEGKQIEFKIKETLRKKWAKGFLAPIGASNAITFQHFPFFHMKDMNFVLRSGTEISIKIGGKEREPKKLPIPVDWEFVYLSRYSPAPVIACWNKPYAGELLPLKREEQSACKDKTTHYELYNNNGHYEICKMTVKNSKHEVCFDFSPPVPVLPELKNRIKLQGRFCAGVDGIPAIVAGLYSIKRQGNIIEMRIHPQEGWQPTPGQSWVRSWEWQSIVTVASDNKIMMNSGWNRIKQGKE